jgi:hypothetical protein
MSGIDFVMRLSVLAVLLMAGIEGAAAQSADDVSAETHQFCMPDAVRLCRSFIPNVAKITACMTEKWAQVSPECRAAMAREDKAIQVARRQRVRTD